MSVFLGNIRTSYNMNPIVISASPILKKGVLRPDAELVQTYSYDKYINAGEGITIPAYTTSATTLKPSEDLSTTYQVDYLNYQYYILFRGSAIPTYSISTAGKGRTEYIVQSGGYELVVIEPDTMHGLLDPSLIYTSRVAAFYSMGNMGRLLYYSNGTTLASYNGAAYGVYLTQTAPTISSGVITVKTPALMIRGNATYLSSTYFNAITDIRYQWIIEIYRHPIGSLNMDGWADATQLMQVIECTQSTTGKLE